AATSGAPAPTVRPRGTTPTGVEPAARMPSEPSTGARGRKSRTEPGSTARYDVIRQGSGTGSPHRSRTVVARTGEAPSTTMSEPRAAKRNTGGPPPAPRTTDVPRAGSGKGFRVRAARLTKSEPADYIFSRLWQSWGRPV